MGYEIKEPAGHSNSFVVPQSLGVSLLCLAYLLGLAYLWLSPHYHCTIRRSDRVPSPWISLLLLK